MIDLPLYSTVEIIVSENILNGYQDWNRGVTVRTYAISQEGIHLSYQMGFDSYGVIHINITELHAVMFKIML